MSIVKKIGIVACVTALTECASITQGTSQTIIFNLEPKDINCVATRDGDGQIGSITTTNNTLTVSKDKDDIVVSCKAPQHKPKTVRLVSSTQAAGVVGGIFLDLGITDMITGAMWKYQESMTIALEKE
jgi:hypothetical protein